MPGINGTIDLELTDTKTNAIIMEKTIPMNSFLNNMANLMATVFNNKWYDLHSTEGGVITTLYLSSGYTFIATAGNEYGIVVGTGDTAWDYGQNCLIAQITHGTGAGQLIYGMEVATDPTWSDTKWLFPKYRNFTNNSGGTIIVKEIGVCGFNSYSSCRYMVSRDVPTPITMSDSNNLKVTMSIELTA